MDTPRLLEEPEETLLCIRLADAEDANAIRTALATYSSLGVGQLEALYWNLLRTGKIPINQALRAQPGTLDARLAKVAALLDEIKHLLGLPYEACLPMSHPDVHDLTRRAYRLELQLKDGTAPA